jgi:hypothetical protein
VLGDGGCQAAGALSVRHKGRAWRRARAQGGGAGWDTCHQEHGQQQLPRYLSTGMQDSAGAHARVALQLLCSSCSTTCKVCHRHGHRHLWQPCTFTPAHSSVVSSNPHVLAALLASVCCAPSS